MPKAIISNRIYLEVDDLLTSEIAKKLLYKISNGVVGRFAKVETVRMYKIPKRGVLSIPQGRQELIPKGYEILDKRTLVPVTFPAPKFPLLPDQQVVYDQVEDSCFINALVGWGKTFTALWIAKKLGQKTLIIVHTAALRDQWVEEVEKLFGFTPDTISEGKCNFSTPIVVSNVQTLVKFADSLHKEFGTVVVDEAHHTPSTTLTNSLDCFSARYRIALSGTRERKDGKHVLFNDFFGPILHRPPMSNTVAPRVQAVHLDYRLTHEGTWSDLVTKLLSDRDYQDIVAALAIVKISQGYKVLIVSERVDFSIAVAEKISAHYSAKVIDGSTTSADRKTILSDMISDKLGAICASRAIFSEGISCNILSCLILPSPMSAGPLLEQLIGRIQRLHPNKPQPILLDIVHTGVKASQRFMSRKGFYFSRGWEVDTI
jgi:superfamily II DNA or RNA helicase